MTVYLEQQQFDDLLLSFKRDEHPSVDTEGFSEDDNRLIAYDMTSGVSLGTAETDDYLAFNHKISDDIFGQNLPPAWLAQLKEVIENQQCLVFHNAKHDLNALRRVGINYTGKFYDTMLMAHLIDENIISKKLDYLSKMYGGKPKNRPADMQAIIDGFGWGWVPVNLMREYARNDARITYDLFINLLGEFREQGFEEKDVWEVEQGAVRLSGEMEMAGIRIDTALCAAEAAKGNAICSEITKYLRLNPASSKDLERFLLGELGLPVLKRTPKGKVSFDAKVMDAYDQLLSKMDDPRAKMILRYRRWSKVVSTNYQAYIDKLSPDGRLRPNYLLHGTVTGRLSCRHPNLQNIPKTSDLEHNGRLKKAFIPAEGYRLIEVDYAQLELRLAAAYAKETRLIEALNDPNRDVFTEMATALKMPRDKAKRLNYALAYGAGAPHVAEIFDVSTLAANGIITNYYRTFSNLRAIVSLSSRRALDNGYVNMWTGRRRHFNNPEKQAHKAFNSVMQGGAVEIVKRAMLRLRDLVSEDCRMLLQIHDSVVFEIREDLVDTYVPEISSIMEAVKPDFGVKFRVDSHEWGS